MPVQYREFTITGTVKKTVDDVELESQPYMNINVNTLALSDAECGEIVAFAQKIMLKHSDLFTNVSSNINSQEAKTVEEADSERREEMTEYIEGWRNDDGSISRDARDGIIAEQRDKTSWQRLSGRKLDILNELLGGYGFEPLVREDFNA